MKSQKDTIRDILSGKSQIPAPVVSEETVEIQEEKKKPHPHSVVETGMLRKELGGHLTAKLRNGERYKLNAKALNGKIPELGHVLDVEKHEKYDPKELMAKHGLKEEVEMFETEEQLDESQAGDIKKLNKYSKKFHETILAHAKHYQETGKISKPLRAKANYNAKKAQKALDALTEEMLEEMSDEDFDYLVENIEQLDELSKDTLKSYIKKSPKSLADHALNLASKTLTYDPTGHKEYLANKKYQKKKNNKEKGVERALNRLHKEETEQLDEISSETLKSYKNKADSSIRMANKFKDHDEKELEKYPDPQKEVEKDMKEYHEKNVKEARLKIARRLAGLRKANMREEEQLDEISSKTIRLYMNKAIKAKHQEMDEKNRAKRAKGVDKGYNKEKQALDRESKLSEESEQLDELSKNTLGSYIRKAKDSIEKSSATAALSASAAGEALNSVVPSLYKHNRDIQLKHKKKIEKRHMGTNRAVDRLVKEAQLSDYDTHLEKAKAHLADLHALIKHHEQTAMAQDRKHNKVEDSHVVQMSHLSKHLSNTKYGLMKMLKEENLQEEVHDTFDHYFNDAKDHLDMLEDAIDGLQVYKKYKAHFIKNLSRQLEDMLDSVQQEIEYMQPAEKED